MTTATGAFGLASRPAPPPPEANPLEVVLLVVSIVTLIVLMSAVVRWDERRLARKEDEAALERAWLPSSRDSALIGLAMLASPLLSLFAVLWHFWRTRRFHPKGFLFGALAVLAVLVGNALVVTGLAWALGLPLDD